MFWLVSASGNSQHVIVVGGGIGGASAAYSLAKRGQFNRITLIETERELAYHTTGRSAALFTLNYGEGPVRPLSKASHPFMVDPPDGLADHPILEKRGIMNVAAPECHDVLERNLKEGQKIDPTIEEIDLSTAAELAPHIRFESDYRAMFEANAADIDVAGLHQAFVRGFRSAGGEIATATRLDSAVPDGEGWRIETTAGPLHADVLVNASGAWADVVAKRAGITPIGFTPMRRTAFMVNSRWENSTDFVMVAEARHDWYLRPDGAQFMCSPADEIPSEPCDAKPEEIDIARTIEMLNQATTLDIRSINSSWAGLRTFSPDRSMVIGPEPGQENFIWCAGQGGTGIQTSPGAGELVADLVTTGRPSDDMIALGVEVDALLPNRYR